MRRHLSRLLATMLALAVVMGAGSRRPKHRPKGAGEAAYLTLYDHTWDDVPE